MLLADEGHYVGKLDTADAETADLDLLVQSFMKPEAQTARAGVALNDVAALFERRDLISVAVLDDEDRLLGCITIDDVVDIIHEEADLFAPVLQSAKQRAVWLGINLGKAFVAAWVVGLFEEALDKIAVLAVLMPIIASMCGIAGSRTL
jgi:magnesium transporter